MIDKTRNPNHFQFTYSFNTESRLETRETFQHIPETSLWFPEFGFIVPKDAIVDMQIHFGNFI